MSSARVWLFRTLVMVATGLMFLSWFMPWWTARVPIMGTDPLLLMYPYGLKHFVPASLIPYFEESIPPFWLTIVAFVFIVADIAALLFSLFLKGKWGKLLLGGAGLGYIGFSAIAMIYAWISVSSQGLAFIGSSPIPFIFHTPTMVATLEPWFFIAQGVGLLCIALALLRDRITGKPKLSA